MVIESLLWGSDDHDGIIGRFSRRSSSSSRASSTGAGSAMGHPTVRGHTVRLRGIAGLAGAQRPLAGWRTSTGCRPDRHWHPGLPAEPSDLFDSATLDLTPDEALFLQGRILDKVPDSFLAVLVLDGTADLEAPFPWDHPLARTAPPSIRSDLHHADLFSLVAWGAALVYNDELSRLLDSDGGQSLDVDYAADLDSWQRDGGTRGDALDAGIGPTSGG